VQEMKQFSKQWQWKTTNRTDIMQQLMWCNVNAVVLAGGGVAM